MTSVPGTLRRGGNAEQHDVLKEIIQLGPGKSALDITRGSFLERIRGRLKGGGFW